MDLKDFIASSLQQIVEGVKLAQQAEGGDNVNATLVSTDLGGNLINSGAYGLFTRVDFDVAVSAETSGKGGANLKVFGVGFEGGGEHKSGAANRLAFSVPVRLPDGDTERTNEIARKRRESTEALRAATTTRRGVV
ncbi:hypothetical protein [Phyllobacterium sp. YR531]|uniref:hypothetical protein n=1 Tax=Phyllobacterium sp. YR531 TaxID=1144343 RepID=UPI00026F7605|nr:hypothetical protein [Phyllobacterium sp. YR531]EJM98893.1 hypothetical protein PMI41_04655 [Phyllobacterium sp. YR531]